jgi:hypothetical protein
VIPVTLPPASARVQSLIVADARAFGVSLSSSVQSDLSSFIEFGTTPLTVRLGEGERRAMVRDLLDTLRGASIGDLERLASGQIPLARNLAQERAQLPRVRTTFRRIFGHDPVFSNPQENLAWNTMMYRIRFPRNLTQEQAGILAFRRLFGRTPSDPFQWATVRVMGYVRG